MTTLDDIFSKYGPDPFSDLPEEGLAPRKRGRPRKPKTITTSQATYFTTESKPTEPAAPAPSFQKPWKGKFYAVDGEGWDGKYTLLQMTGRPDLYNPKGLSTRAILKYLTDHHISSTNAFVGFGLNYDFEMWLRDVPDDDFLALLNGEEIDYEGYTLSYIPRKMFSITYSFPTGKEYTNPDTGLVEMDVTERTITFQDTMGFFQSSFENALKKWNIDIPPIITEFKALRGDFHEGIIDKIKLYNRTELSKLVELMEALRVADHAAWHAIGLDPKHSGRIWYGPGSRASNFLKQTFWIEEHPVLNMPSNVPGELMRTLLPRNTVEELAKNRAEERNLLSGIKLDIVKRVLAVGGLRGLSKGYEHFADEIKSRVPAKVRKRITKKNGLPLDELADELSMTVEHLLDALSNAEDDGKADYHDFIEEAEDTLLSLRDASLFEHPFAAAYYGGRIEAAAQGVFRGTLYDYDINSAYPYAIAHLPKWHANDLVWVDGMDTRHRMGMYFVRWALPDGCNFYPFPFRAKSGNVFFPREGAGWYMSPEVEAALSNWPEGELYNPLSIGMKRPGICVVGGFVLKDTDGAGDGIAKVPDSKLCTSALKMMEMADVRLKAKAVGETSEKSLKLIINSCYGKLIQQIGTHKFLNTFAAAWVTSTCRALISRAIGMDKKNQVISIMTDGILTLSPLPVTMGKDLGQFELTTVEGAIQLVPGVYRLDTDLRNKPHTVRYRGVGKNFSYFKALRTLRGEGEYRVKLRMFISRTLALHMPKAYGDKVYQFVGIERNEDFGLKSKRAGKAKLTKKREHVFLPPKAQGAGINPISWPYVLDVEPVELSYDFCTSEEELLSKGLSSILLDELL